ncbi:hypothetical protein OQJ46_07535 [Microbulbifer thermotolerans]|uniref:Uncharacterized protein n=1 Tax=Microbulbifer thermotolerans TaxID=252514 RepID=A0AB35I171_MICTH|nr:hypothetical protein [Microbulbifer thermotolerans]MCX2778617.1 hypothetical protein [Microbulbifer thermotolerans]MCX2782837.1 hypothetical protein [Microbulbifer thermotolerans]MCX2794093.1 hypothetical protein [Microbulbifer thermotolerans]MCX2802988.1 hypothetical protein [Microbulbifer thermotolerans]MCX2803874.1 hypothetical protein [Microbulbifer thermotolerans]
MLEAMLNCDVFLYLTMMRSVTGCALILMGAAAGLLVSTAWAVKGPAHNRVTALNSADFCTRFFKGDFIVAIISFVIVLNATANCPQRAVLLPVSRLPFYF